MHQGGPSADLFKTMLWFLAASLIHQASSFSFADQVVGGFWGLDGPAILLLVTKHLGGGQKCRNWLFYCELWWWTLHG